MNPRRRRQNRQRRLDRAAVLVVASRVGVPHDQAIREFSFGRVRVKPINVLTEQGRRLIARMVHGRWGNP